MKLGVSIAIASLCVACVSCGPATPTPMQLAGTATLSLAQADAIVATVCANTAVYVGEAKGKAEGERLLDKCQAIHDRAHEQIVALAYAVDAYRAGTGGAPACAILDARAIVLDELDFARAIGASIDPSIDDTIAFAGNIASGLVGTCARVAQEGDARG